MSSKVKVPNTKNKYVEEERESWSRSRKRKKVQPLLTACKRKYVIAI